MYKSNIQRIMSDIDMLKLISDPDFIEGTTRYSYSNEDKQAREYILKQCKELGLSVKVDGVGNIRARLNGTSSQKPILVGSHLDTVTNGGAYDGVVGVVCGLESIRVISENKVKIKKPVELIIFSEEEGSNFAGTLLGSKALTGKITIDDLKNIKDQNEETAYNIIKNAGYDPDSINQDVIQPDQIEAMIEMHIEQGDFLQSSGYRLGIVKAIAGQRTYKAEICGVSNHAGSTRMASRHDSLVGASDAIVNIEKAASDYNNGSAVATVGKVNCYPNSTNAIAGKVEFFIDIRDVEKEGIEYLSQKTKDIVDESCAKYGLSYKIELLAESPIVELDKTIMEKLFSVSKKTGEKCIMTNSGAVHDSVMLTSVTKVGMLFVPSVEGLSHCPEEFTEQEDIKLGCDVLIETIIALAN